MYHKQRIFLFLFSASSRADASEQELQRSAALVKFCSGFRAWSFLLQRCLLQEFRLSLPWKLQQPSRQGILAYLTMNTLTSHGGTHPKVGDGVKVTKRCGRRRGQSRHCSDLFQTIWVKPSLPSRMKAWRISFQWYFLDKLLLKLFPTHIHRGHYCKGNFYMDPAFC